MFTADVIQQLGFYVYRLVDPRSGATFYVGKGVGNRVFSHAAGLSADDAGIELPKLKVISDIKAAGLEVEHHLHRHGLDEQTALHVEAALIDAYPQLTNAVRGHGATSIGTATTAEILARYQSEPAIWYHNMLLVGVNKTHEERSTYEAARFAWKLSLKNVQSIEYVLAIRDRLIIDIFRPHRWLPATLENFPNAEAAIPGRIGFEGARAEEMVGLYVGKRVPEGCNLSQGGLKYVRPDP